MMRSLIALAGPPRGSAARSKSGSVASGRQRENLLAALKGTCPLVSSVPRPGGSVSSQMVRTSGLPKPQASSRLPQAAPGPLRSPVASLSWWKLRLIALDVQVGAILFFNVKRTGKLRVTRGSVFIQGLRERFSP